MRTKHANANPTIVPNRISSWHAAAKFCRNSLSSSNGHPIFAFLLVAQSDSRSCELSLECLFLCRMEGKVQCPGGPYQPSEAVTQFTQLCRLSGSSVRVWSTGKTKVEKRADWDKSTSYDHQVCIIDLCRKLGKPRSRLSSPQSVLRMACGAVSSTSHFV